MGKDFDDFKHRYYEGEFDESIAGIAKSLKQRRAKIDPDDDIGDVEAIGGSALDETMALIEEYHKWVNS